MKHPTVLFALCTSLATVPALAAPFAQGDAAAGKATVTAQCDACHAGRFEGDPNRIYTRPNHRIKSASALAQQISACNANLGSNLFPEDETNIGAYLNSNFYKFK